MKIVWRVAEAPTGRYRSFQTRGWPMAYHNNPDGPAVASLYCETDYVPRLVKTGDHAEIVVRVADRSKGAMEAFTWRTLKRRAATLAEAKKLVAKFFREHPGWLPQ